MSEYFFGLYRGHLSAKLIRAVERKFPEVSVVNYTEPRGEKRGWFAGPNRGSPFDDRLGQAVMAYARSVARGKDSDALVVEPVTRVVDEAV